MASVLFASGGKPSSSKLWDTVRQLTRIDDRFRDLLIQPDRLTTLNDVDFDHQFRPDDSVVLPVQLTRAVKVLASIDTISLPRTPPLQAFPAVQFKGVMRLFATAPAVTQAFTPAESDDASIDTLLAARPRPSAQKLWVKVRQPVSIDELSRDLSMGSERLAMLNNVDTDHRFDRGEWLVVPAQKTRAVKLLSSVDTSELRRTPPLQSSPPLQSKGVVRLGDTVMAIAQRYGLTMAELLKLNPGMQTARLVAGNEVKLAQAEPVRQRAVLGLQSSPPVHSKGVVTLRDQLMAIADSDGFTMAELKRLNPDKPNALQVSGSEVTLIEVEPVRQRAVLGLKPSTSGGLSWPQIPGLGTDMTHPKPSNNRRLAFRQRLAAKQPAWRSYAHTQGGALLVNWGTWKLAAGGVRTADALHGRNPVVIAVHCDRLQFTVRSLSSNRWPAWDGIPPGTASAAIAEDLCTNLAK